MRLIIALIVFAIPLSAWAVGCTGNISVNVVTLFSSNGLVSPNKIDNQFGYAGPNKLIIIDNQN